MKVQFIIVFVFIFVSNLYAQNNRVDSLLAMTKSASDEEHIEILFQLVNISYDSSAFNDLINYSKEAGVISRKIGDIENTIRADYYVAFGFNYTNEYDSAMYYYQKVMQNLSIDNDSAKISMVLRSMGILYHEQGILSQAKIKYEQSLDIAERIGDSTMILSALKSLGTYYSDIGEFESGVKVLLRALVIAEQLHIPKEQSNMFMSLGIIYGKMGNYDLALKYQKESYIIEERLNDMRGIASTLNNIGVIFKKTGEIDSALHYYNRSLIIKRKIGDAKGITTSLENIGIILSEQGKNDEALQCFDEGLLIADSSGLLKAKTNLLLEKAKALVGKGLYIQAAKSYLTGLTIAKERGFREQIRDIYEGMAELSYKRGNIDDVYNYLKLYIVYKDSILNESNQSAIVEMQTRFETEKVEKENELLTKNAEIQTLRLKKQQTQFWLLGGGICFIILLGILAFALYRSRQRNMRAQLEKKNMETEKRMLRSQMNPHFIFNAMSSIQGYITSNDNYNAMMYLSNFAELTRGILENSRQAMISLADEIKTLNLYIDLERLRLKNKFDFTIEIKPEIDPETIYVPPMLIQPFVENAIKHGLKNKDGNGMLTIDIKIEQELLKCSVSDNGMGRDLTKKNKADGHRSLGMQVTQERLEMLKKEKKVNCYFIFNDLTDNSGKASGTRVDISLPFEEE